MISKAAAQRLLELYVGELIVVHLKNMNIVTTNENQEMIELSPMVEGFVVDIDRNFIYLGTADGMVLKTLTHDVVGIIEVNNLMEEMLSNDMPVSEGDVH